MGHSDRPEKIEEILMNRKRQHLRQAQSSEGCLTSPLVEVRLIPKTLKGLVENKEHGERGGGSD